MNEELTVAIDVMRQMPASRTWFIPVLINGGRIPDRRISSVETLSDLNAVDLGHDWNGGVKKILTALGHDDPRLARALSLVGVAQRFDTPETLQAIQHLGKLRIADKQVMRVLIDATTSSTIQRTKSAAVDSLVEIGAGAVPDLAAALQTAEEVSRKCILHALARIGPGAGAAVPAIVALLRDAGPAVPDEEGWLVSV